MEDPLIEEEGDDEFGAQLELPPRRKILQKLDLLLPHSFRLRSRLQPQVHSCTASMQVSIVYAGGTIPIPTDTR